MNQEKPGLLKNVLSTLATPGSPPIAGGHQLKTLDWLTPNPKGFTPTNPGDMSDYGATEILEKVPEKAISQEEADRAVVESAEAEHNAENLKRYLKAQGKKVVTEASVQEGYRQYQAQVATGTFRRVRANAGYNNALQGLRAAYTEVGVSAHKAERRANNRIQELRAKWLGQVQE